MKVCKRRLVKLSLADFGTQVADDDCTPVVCIDWLMQETDLPRSVTVLYICISPYYVADAFSIRLDDRDTSEVPVRVDRERRRTPTYPALRKLIRQHGHEIGQDEWIAWIWFEYTP